MATTPAKRACSVCGTLLPDDGAYCPVCALRGVVETQRDSGSDMSSELSFEHYRVLQNAAGKPLELGRGAMGVTYKAVDVNLRCPVALKTINARLIGDESARRRFVREARTAASVRHPNVASVFHLGRSGDGYFYAMEYAEGETLGNLIKRCGRLEPKVAVEITSQVAAGLGAIHEQNLVHRDIKPTNIMVSLKDGGRLIAKIIDLGLAKGLSEASLESAISVPGGFAGTPEFASPEQFAGVGADIRSDLYSLGVTLWNMLTGEPPFRGTPAELMYQHLNAALPVEQLERVPQPVVTLLKVLLEKDPVRRFKSPLELLKTMPTIIRAIRAKRAIKHHEMLTTSANKPTSGQGRSPAIRAPKRSIAVLPFDTLGHGKGNTYFADGVQDEILANLAKVSQLRVTSRTSVMTYRPSTGRDLRAIASSLRVANVVEGTVRRDGNRIRITVRLVDARKDVNIWSETYDRQMTDIFTIQSEVAQTIARKLTAKLSPEEKERIEAKPTENLEAYDLYLRAKQLIISAVISWSKGPAVQKQLREAVEFLDHSVRLDPEFALAYCASAKAHDLIYFYGDRTPEQRSLGDAAINRAMSLQPESPDVHWACAYHLFVSYGDYERARVQLEIARRGSPNNVEALVLAARMDRRQGHWKKAIQNLEAAITRDPSNRESILESANTCVFLRQFGAAAGFFDRLIRLFTDQEIFKVYKAYFGIYLKTGDNSALSSAIASLHMSLTAETEVLTFRMIVALSDRNWKQAKEIIQVMNGEDDGYFAYGGVPVPVGCYSILIARLEGKKIRTNSGFAETREKLDQKVQRMPGNASLLSQLAVVDALLNHQEIAVSEAKQAIEILPISKDAIDGAALVVNLAVVYAWANELDLAFETMGFLTNTPNGIYYGPLRRDPYWDPLRKDPRFDKLLAELAPRD